MESLTLPGVTPGSTRQALMKPSSKALDVAVVAYLCNFLEENAAKPWKVLKAAGLAPKTDADWHTADAVNALYTAAHRYVQQTLNTDSETASDTDDSDTQPAFEDSKDILRLFPLFSIFFYPIFVLFIIIMSLLL